MWAFHTQFDFFGHLYASGVCRLVGVELRIDTKNAFEQDQNHMLKMCEPFYAQYSI